MADTSKAFISVKFDAVGRTHQFLLPEAVFDPPFRAGEEVVVANGVRRAYGTVVQSIPQLDAARRPSVTSHDRVVRRASRQDVVQRLKQQRRERDVYRMAVMKIKELRLPIKLVKVEQQLPGPKLVCFFTAESRINFREFRELTREFRDRIEMRQIGARDEARLLGGYGTCGRPLCCTTWFPGFDPISIKMVKRQNLSLNPLRLAGLCGRLKCCLRYELPNAAGDQFAGCANENSCSRAGGGCGTSCDGDCSGCGS